MAASLALCFAVFELAGAAILRATLGEEHQTDVDHRLKPNARRGINQDGIRNPHAADHYGEDSWNLVFLGDSYTYGVYVKVEQAFPALVARLLNEAGAPREAKAANFGWASSSPLLSLRLLRDIGAKYRPHLVVLCLDLTDFHDDLRYARMLREGRARLSPTRFLLRRSGLDLRLDAARRWLGLAPHHALPAERFFVARQPLAESRPWLRETEGHIHEIAREAGGLGAEFLLVMLPRPFQYDPRESPDNWERAEYDAASPHALEVFAWLEQLAARTPFPVISLLEPFRGSEAFPTAFAHDPHWNEAGHEVAARALADEITRLVETGRLRGPG